MIHDLNNYKHSKKILDDLKSIIKVVDLTAKALTHFKMYMPVARLLRELEKEKKILEVYQNKYNNIKNTKGKINE